MNWYAHATVATVVEKDQKYLLVHENSDGQQVYNQPAGHLEPNESLIQAATRETLEETGWLVEPTHLLGFSQYRSPVNEVTYLRTTFVATPLRYIEETIMDRDILEAVWLSYDEILALRDHLRSPLVLRDILLYEKGLRYPLELIYTHI